MILEIQHETTMEYSQPVSEWLCELRMEPISDRSQRCHSFQITIGQPAAISKYLDGFGNRVHHFNLLKPPATLRILAASVVETEDAGVGPIASHAEFPAGVPADEWQLPLETIDYLPLRGPARATSLLEPHLALLRPVPGMRVGMWVCQVAEHIRSRFQYARDVTDATSPIDHLLTRGKGVCQDFTHLMISILRSFGVPARYVSGYIHRPNRESQSHAWCEVWLPDVGWTGFDPTNGCPVNRDFVKTAVGRDFSDVPPNKGVYRGAGEERINVRVATRTLERLPSLSWHDQLPPLDVPVHSVLRTAPVYGDDTEVQQQQ
ncbi:MAG: transglutaminase family protein [Planctomycetota bacterium]|jgi:transglutaminase-like putative cysteine protease|nr:MAG: transglutaminase family protein [Planctomycetota bacterium]